MSFLKIKRRRLLYKQFEKDKIYSSIVEDSG